MNIEDPKDLLKLKTAVDASRRILKPFRTNRAQFIRQFVGKHYSSAGNSKEVPVNFVELLVTTYTRLLAGGTPNASVTTIHRDLRSPAFLLELALNHVIKEINLQETLEDAVADAMFGVGLVKIGLNSMPEEVGGYMHDSGQPFVDIVSLDDWVHDTNAKTLEQCSFMGNRYRLPLEYVKDSDEFKKTDDLAATPLNGHGEEGEGKAAAVGGGRNGKSEETQDMIELYDLFLPSENQVVTIPVQSTGEVGTQEPLRVVDWEGPEVGPYRILRFTKVPDNIMPLSPVSVLIDLHNMANALFRKIGRQATRQKTIGVVEHGNGEDAQRILNANDGEVVEASSGAVNEINLGGMNQENLMLFLQTKDLNSYFSGNIDSVAGLSPMAETLGQEQMIGQSASQRIAAYKVKTKQFAADILGDLGFYLWTDPLIDLPLIKRVPKTDIEIPVKFNPETREGDFLDYNLSIVPYSMEPQEPGEKARKTIQVLQFAMPLLPAMQEQGIAIDFAELIRQLGDAYGLDELNAIFVSQQPQQEQGPVGTLPQKFQQPQPGGMAPPAPRRAIPGASRAGKDSVLSQLLMGGKPQQAEMATMGRNVG